MNDQEITVLEEKEVDSLKNSSKKLWTMYQKARLKKHAISSVWEILPSVALSKFSQTPSIALIALEDVKVNLN